MTQLSHFAQTIFARTYAFHPKETWDECAARVAKFVARGNAQREKDYAKVISERKFIPGGRYLYSAGRPIPQTTNCYLMRAGDSREEWAELVKTAILALTTGGGVGTNYSSIRPAGTPIVRYGGTASGPISLMAMLNEVARHVMAGGKRRSALWAGLNWQHPDVEEFIKVKNWSTLIRAGKEQDFNHPAKLDMTNISVCLDDKFFRDVREEAGNEAWQLYYRICKGMCKTGEPGLSIDVGKQAKDDLRNPCTEVVSKDNGDCCNLGSINFARIKDVGELEEVTAIGTQFLLDGLKVGWMPHPLFKEVREQNNRIGLGLMGLHEWCLQNGLAYAPSDKLGEWLGVWRCTSNEVTDDYCAGVRAIAPTGTIGILAETTTGIEPIYCVAYKRRFLGEGQRWQHSYVIDPTAKRLIDDGVEPGDIEDSVSLAKDVEKRIAMQAFVQGYVDQAISSTINLPEYGEEGNNNVKQFARILLKYLPKLRGITVYPDGSREGQPITAIDYKTALRHKDVVYEEDDSRCVGGVCGL